MVAPNSLLDLDPGIGQVASMVRFQILDRDLEVVGNAIPLSATSITAKVTGSGKRTLQGVTFDEHVLRDIDPFTNRVKPYWVLEDGTQWPCGVFMFTHSICKVGTYVDVLETTLTDQDFLLDQGTRSSFGIVANGTIEPAMESLISQVRITNVVMPTGTGAKVADPVNWPAGTSRLQMLNDMCNLAGWLPPYFDNDGVLTIRIPPDLDNSNPDHVYSSSNSRIQRNTIVETDNLDDAPNVYVVTSSGPSGGEITASAQVDSSLPYSVENRRFEVVNVFRAQGITDTAQAQQMASTRAASSGTGFKNIEFEGFADPRHDLFQTVEWNGHMYREIAWTMKLQPGGSHSHSITDGGFPLAG